MKSSFLHFLITFVIAFAVFGILAYTYYDSLASQIPSGNTEESEPAESGAETSKQDNSSGILIDIPDESDVTEEKLGAVNGLIIAKNQDGFVIGARFIRINADKRMVVSCDFPTSVSLYNSVGVLIPISDYFSMIPGEEAGKAICALTGYRADFYLELTPDSLCSMLPQMDKCTFTMDRVIDYVNPKYENYVPLSEIDYPEDYYRHLDAGEVELNELAVETLLEYYRLQTAAGKSIEISNLLINMYESAIRAIVIDQKEIFRSNAKGLMSVLKEVDTNISEEFLKEHAEKLFHYGDYYLNEISYTSYDVTLPKIKDADR